MRKHLTDTYIQDILSVILQITQTKGWKKMKAKQEAKQNWYFTFGVGHGNRMFYVRINGTNQSARARMHELFGTIWAFDYSEKQFGDSAERWDYKLHPISLTDEAIA